MYTIKYHPKNLDEYFRYHDGQDRKIKSVLEKWVKNPDRPLIIYSSPGTGKTALVYALANTYNMNVYEINSSNLNEIDLDRISRYDLFGRRILILVDDIDAILETSRFDINKIFDLKLPTILTANDIWSLKMKDIRNMIAAKSIYELELKFSKITYRNIIKSVINREGIDISDQEIDMIIDLNYPDIRAGINDLEIKIGTSRDRFTNIFQILNTILTTKPRMLDVKNYLEKNLLIDDYKNLIPFLEWNLIYRYSGDELRKAYMYLAQSDLFFTYATVNRKWNIFTYTSRFISFIATLKNSESKRGVELNRIRIINYLESSIHKELHMSQKKFRRYAYLFKNIFI